MPVAILAAGLLAAAPVAAAPPLLGSTPIWSPPSAASGAVLATGDVDKDGDLDLVVANQGVPSMLFLNSRGQLERGSVWSPAWVAVVRSAALGDVDGDGFPDLVLAPDRGPLVFFRNQGLPSFFPAMPTGDLPLDGASVVRLADVDRDGDLDLIATGPGGPTATLENRGGGYGAAPAWQVAEGANDLALGDIDADGRLDLVAGEFSIGLRLYRGSGPFFADTPSWAAADSGVTALALGDLDGDGRLDLLAGGLAPGASRIWANRGTDFGKSAAMTFADEDSVGAVALGDADADGDLDLALGAWSEARAYRGDGSFGGWSPAFRTPQPVARVVWADVDGDGDLDLLVSGVSAALYDNVTPRFAGPVRAGFAGVPAASADLDDDGDTDLVSLSSWEGRAELHRGVGGGFEAPAAWTSETADAVRSAVLGDVNRDGSLDVACAGNGVTLYRGSRGGFEATPGWRADIGTTSALALGDVDGDGDLDLVTGSAGSQPSLRLYLNRGDGFAAAPDWSDSLVAVHAIALGDVDGDRKLDLVAGVELGTVLFHYVGGSFKARWSIATAGTRGVALGDVDADGDLDLATAVAGFSTVHTNTDGLFDTAPAWSTPRASLSSDVGLGDLDADGDLDWIVLGAFGDSTQVLRNDAGAFAAPPEMLPPGGPHAVLDDLDGDGDLDLATGGGPDLEIHPNRREPAFRGDPEHPALHLPNNAAVLRSVSVRRETANQRRIEFTAADAEADSIWLVAEFQFRGASQWIPVDTPSGPAPFGPLATSPAGTLHVFDWDLVRVSVDVRPVDLRLRAVPVRQAAGAALRIPSFLEAVGPLDIRRPEIAVSPMLVTFDVVTVGDTAKSWLYIENNGNEVLRIESFRFRNTSMVHPNPDPDPDQPLELAPGNRLEVMLVYAPTDPEHGTGPVPERYLDVESNDPIYPTRTVQLDAEARRLVGRAQALVPGGLAPLGEPIVVQLIPEPFVDVEKARLFHGSTASGSFQSSDMTQLGGSFIGSIPGPQVTEVGLVFYVELENSGVVATEPPFAPIDSVHVQPVEEPSQLRSVPQPTSRGDFLVGRELNVQVILQDGTEFQDGTLYYRAGGGQEWKQVPVLINFLLEVTQGTIPAEDVGPRGLEYWVEARTTTTMENPLRDPKVGARRPYAIRTLVPSLLEPTTQPGSRYRMLGVPLEFEPGSARTLDAMLSDQPEFGPYDPFRWRAFRWLGAAGNVERVPGDPAFALEPGRGFWLVSKSEHRVDTAPLEGLSVATDDSVTLVLSPGWNQIANPYAFAVAWDSSLVARAIEPPVGFDPARGASGDWVSEPVSVLEPFAGYFVWSGSARAETLFVPPVAAPRRGVRDRSAAAPPEGWRIAVTARSSHAEDGANAAGVLAAARDELDAQDRHDPPPPPGDWVALAFVPPGSDDRVRRDLRPPSPLGHTWEMEIRSSRQAEEIAVDFELAGGLPPGFALLVVDVDQGTTTPLAGDGRAWPAALRILAHGPERPYRLLLLAGTPAYLEREHVVAAPGRVVLDQNSPNPFNAATRIRFGLPAAARARLEIFDVRGRRVAVLADGVLAGGWHSPVWNGRDSTGRPVASGVYLARLVTPEATLARRIVLLE